VVKVMQMNMLADRLAPPSAFPHVDPAVLVWSHRKDLLLQQITTLDPDVVCLEVAPPHHHLTHIISNS
jgi:mRNA deadenylase 3'-5' endonuclease subunit Ccr4